MSGKELKTKLLTTGKTVKEISTLMGITPQALNTIFNVSDVKTGTLEKLCLVLGYDMTFFYPSNATNNQFVAKARNVTQTGAINETSNNDDVSELIHQNKLLIELLHGQMNKN